MTKRRSILWALGFAVVIGAGVRMFQSPPAQMYLRNGLKLEREGLLPRAEEEYTRAVGCDSAMGQAWLGLARTRSRGGRFKTAEDAYRKALELLSEDRDEALLGLGWLLLLESRTADLDELAERARALGEPHVASEFAVRLLLVRIRKKTLDCENMLVRHNCLGSGGVGLAALRKRAESLPEDNPGRAELARLISDADELARRASTEAGLIGSRRGRLLQAELHLIRGNVTAAKEIAEELSHGGDKTAASAMLMLARMATESGNADEALNWVGEALTIDATNVAARFELKRVQPAMGSFESAMFDIDLEADAAVARRAPGDYTEGMLDLLKGNYAAAIAKLGNAVRRHPEWLQARMSLASAYNRAGNKTQALVEFGKIAKKEPKLISPHLALARILLDTGPMEEAIENARSALALDPNDPRALEMLAEAYIRSDRLIEGVAAFEKRIERAKTHDPSLGRMLDYFQKAAADFRKEESEIESSRDPSSQHKLERVRTKLFLNANAVGMIYLAQGDLDAAWRQFNRMRVISPTAPLTNYRQAQMLVRRGKPGEAVKLLAGALEDLRWVLERNYADSLGLKDDNTGRKEDKLTEEQRTAALRATPVVADFHAELGKIGFETKDYAAALEHSTAALKYSEVHHRAAMQVAAARRAFARKDLEGVPKALEEFAAALDGLDYQELKAKRLKLLQKRELSAEETEKLAALTEQADQARERKHAVLRQCGEYAQGDLTRAPPGMSPSDTVLFSLHTALTGVTAADAEFESGSRVLQRTMAADLSYAPPFDAAAALYTEYAQTWELGRKSYEALVTKMTGLQEELKSARGKLAERERAEDLSREEKKALGKLTEQVNRLVGLLIRLQTQLDKTKYHAKHHTELAEQYHKRYTELASGNN